MLKHKNKFLDNSKLNDSISQIMKIVKYYLILVLQ